MKKLYQNFYSKEQIDKEYNPRFIVKNTNELIEFYVTESKRVSKEYKNISKVAYGFSPDETLDIFLTENSNSPIHIFFHGGYWHSFSSQDFAFVAEGLVRNGILAVIVNYSLCPKVKLNEIVRQARDSVAWVYRNARNFDANPNRISVSGHSAGGHLTGMLLSTEWTKEYGLAQNLIKFFMPISGIFDLKPFPFSWLQPKLNLSSLDVKMNSPLNLKPMDSSPFFIAVGSKESKEFKRQSFEYYKFLKNHGVPAKYSLIKGKNHFNVIHDFLGNGGQLCNHIYKRSI